MKNIFLIGAILLATACKAQKPISEIDTKQVKTSGFIFNIEKIKTELGNEFVEIANSNNKLTKIKQVTPNMPPTMGIVSYVNYDINILTKICGNSIPLQTLKKMAVEKNDRLNIRIKFDTNGFPLELQYLIRKTSLISADDLDKIENGIKKSSFRITFKKEIQKYIVGANYFSIDLRISYADMLKFKLGS